MAKARTKPTPRPATPARRARPAPAVAPSVRVRVEADNLLVLAHNRTYPQGTEIDLPDHQARNLERRNHVTILPAAQEPR